MTQAFVYNVKVVLMWWGVQEVTGSLGTVETEVDVASLKKSLKKEFEDTSRVENEGGIEQQKDVINVVGVQEVTGSLGTVETEVDVASQKKEFEDVSGVENEGGIEQQKDGINVVDVHDVNGITGTESEGVIEAGIRDESKGVIEVSIRVESKGVIEAGFKQQKDGVGDGDGDGDEVFHRLNVEYGQLFQDTINALATYDYFFEDISEDYHQWVGLLEDIAKFESEIEEMEAEAEYQDLQNCIYNFGGDGRDDF